MSLEALDYEPKVSLQTKWTLVCADDFLVRKPGHNENIRNKGASLANAAFGNSVGTCGICKT